MLRRWCLGCVAVGLLSSMLLAKPGVVTTRDGTTYSGDISDMKDTDKFVTITLHGVKTSIDKRNVQKIEYTKTPDDEFADRKSKLAPDDVQGRVAIANWALQNQRADLAVEILQEARKIDPLNRDAAQLLVAAQQQVALNQEAGKSTPTASAATKPAAENTPAPKVAPKAVALPHRLLNNDEINIIRQLEMQPTDKVRVQFAGDVGKEYLSSGNHDAAAFNKMSTTEKAMQIISDGDPKLVNEVRIMTDPPAMVEFRQKVYPLIASACANCHTGTRAGDFSLFQGESVNALYSNFYTLMTYTKTVNGTQYLMIDRTLPARSLFFEFALPSTLTDVSHPEAPSFRPRFRSTSDPNYLLITDWLTNALKPIAPDYHIKVSPKLPSTQPSP